MWVMHSLRVEGSLAPPSLAGKGVGGLGFPNSPTVSFNRQGIFSSHIAPTMPYFYRAIAQSV